MRGADRTDAPACIEKYVASFPVVGLAPRSSKEALEYLQVILEPVIQFIQQLLARPRAAQAAGKPRCV